MLDRLAYLRYLIARIDVYPGFVLDCEMQNVSENDSSMSFFV
jgi:hypothetical protein